MAGLGRAADGSVHARCLPGEEIEPGPDGDGPPRILTPSPGRVTPPCRHFRMCGGCLMQHASDALIAEWKTGIVRQALIGQGIEGEVLPILTSPPRSRRRAKLTGRRTRKGAMVGFHARASDMLIEVPECQLLTPALMATLPALGDLTRRLCSRTDEAAFTVTESLAGPDILIHHPRDLTGPLRIELAAVAEAHGLARLAWGDETVAMRHPPLQQMGRARVTPPPGAFLQATAHGEAALVAQVRAMVGTSARIADLFAGCGTFTLPLAEAAEVLAVEGEAAMIDALDRGWRATLGLHRVDPQARDLFRRPLLPDEMRKLDAVVLDPPRQGAEAQVAQIAGARVPVVAMVSCNPVTFARDARTLISAGYVMGPVTPVDQFRWAAHVEMTARFTIS